MIRTEPRSREQLRAAIYMVLSLMMAARELSGGEKPEASLRREQTISRTPCRMIVVSIRDHKLALLENGEVTRVYPAAVGAANSPTPSGVYTISSMVPNPTYYKPGKVVLPGSLNPLGTRWMGLSLKGYGIHGTNSPRSIGKAASHGCIRLRNKDVEELFELVRPGDVVELRNGPAPEPAHMSAGPISSVEALEATSSTQKRAANNGLELR